MVDLLIKNGTLITMDHDRHIITDGAVAIVKDRIDSVGTTKDLEKKYHGVRAIDADKKVVMPGLIDGHGHAGHAIIKSIGMDIKGAWEDTCYQVYQRGSDEEFWYADALLGGLERLKSGTTTSVNFLGGGDQIMRTDDAVYGSAHCEAIKEIGIKEFLAVGPSKPPFPREYSYWKNESRLNRMISFEKQLQVSEDLIQGWHRSNNGRISICLALPVVDPKQNNLGKRDEQFIKYMANETNSLSKKYKLKFTQDGHSRGTVKYAHEELGVLGPDAFISHCINLHSEEIEICAQTNTKIVHNPSAIFSILGRCPVPELLDAGVTVFLGSDGVAPDRSYDMFRHMFQAMRYHRTYFHDPAYLPAGKLLEMVTIDAAQGLGLENEIGSLEPGKKADIIIIDMKKPHLMPFTMPAYRIAYYANGSDVDTVIVDGEILMEDRIVKNVNEEDIFKKAQKSFEKAVKRCDLEKLLEIPERFWGFSKY